MQMQKMKLLKIKKLIRNYIVKVSTFFIIRKIEMGDVIIISDNLFYYN